MTLPIILVAARMSSRRLPEKSMMKFGGMELIGHVIEAVCSVKQSSGVCLVTSLEPDDDAIEAWCRRNMVDCWRGSLLDVSDRMLSAAEHSGHEAFVRVSGDSPMIDPEIIDKSLNIFLSEELDYVTNTYPRSFPKGQSVEVVRIATLRELIGKKDVSALDREHVTSVLKRNFVSLRTAQLSPAEWNLSSIPTSSFPSLAIDTVKDAERFSEVLNHLNASRAWPLGWIRCAEVVSQLRSFGVTDGLQI